MSRSSSWKCWLRVAARWIVGGVFIAACIPKLKDPADFALAIFRYQLLPFDLINATAILLPWLELVTGLALIFWSRMRRGAALLLLVMLVVFTTAISINIYRGIDISCGCFSVNPKGGHIGWLNIARNLSLIVLCFLAARNKPTEEVPAQT